MVSLFDLVEVSAGGGDGGVAGMELEGGECCGLAEGAGGNGGGSVISPNLLDGRCAVRRGPEDLMGRLRSRRLGTWWRASRRSGGGSWRAFVSGR